jgi:hypothetical protein
MSYEKDVPCRLDGPKGLSPWQHNYDDDDGDDKVLLSPLPYE